MEKPESITTAAQGKIIQIDEGQVRQHLSELVRGSVEETLNAMLQKEADELCKARRYERAEGRVERLDVGFTGDAAAEAGGLLGAWALDACPPEEAARLENHLTGCRPCTAEAARLRDDIHQLREQALR